MNKLFQSRSQKELADQEFYLSHDRLTVEAVKACISFIRKGNVEFVDQLNAIVSDYEKVVSKVQQTRQYPGDKGLLRRLQAIRDDLKEERTEETNSQESV
jgi:hypothetical protein